MESPELVGKEVALASGLYAPHSHSSDAQSIQKDNDVASKTFGDLPTEIRLLSKLKVAIYLLWRRSIFVLLMKHCTTLSVAWTELVFILQPNNAHRISFKVVSSTDHETNILISLELLYSQRPHD